MTNKEKLNEKEKKEKFNQKIQELKEAVKDYYFMEDLTKACEDFNIVDSECFSE